MNTQHYRTELKYLCTSGMLHLMEHKLQALMAIDSYSLGDDYIVSSVYFDDYRDSCCFDNEMGISERYKFRIRVYNDNTNHIKLEKKIKYNNKCYKKSATLDQETYYKLYSGDVSSLIHETTNNLVREFAILILSRQYRPKAIIRYERKAFVYEQANVRVTLDRNITTSIQTDCFLSSQETMQAFPVLDHGLHILEVKYTDVLPYYIYQAIQMNTLQQTTFSKYYIGRKAARDYGGGIV